MMKLRRLFSLGVPPCVAPPGLLPESFSSPPPSVWFSRRASCSRDDLLATRRHVAIALSAATRDVLFSFWCSSPFRFLGQTVTS